MMSLKALNYIVLLLIVLTSQAACGLAENGSDTKKSLVVTSVTPTNAKTDVPVDTAISIIFDKAVHSSTISGNAVKVTATQDITGKVRNKTKTKTVTFTPDEDLPPQTTITVTISADVKDLDANGLAAEYSWSFTTAAKVDKIAPMTTISTIVDGTDDRPSVILKCVDEDSGCAKTHYTLDESTPTTDSSVYTDPILLQADKTTVNFFSIDVAGNSETVRAKSYVIDPPDETAPTTSASLADGMYDSVKFISLTCTDNDSGCRAIYFTLDGSTPSNLSSIYSDELRLDADTTLKFFSVDVAGNNESVKTHTYVINLAAKRIAAGVAHSIALKDDGSVWAWGDNQYGQLGDATRIQSSRPVQVCADASCSSFLSDIRAVVAGSDYSLALNSNGAVWAWGYNAQGQLGDNSLEDRLFPVQVCANSACSSYLNSVAALAAGDAHTLALQQDGTVWAWGFNTAGQLGNNTTDNSSVPVQVCAVADCSSYLNQVIQVVAGKEHAVALKEDGSVWAWGLNTSRQLGDGLVDNRLIPVQVCAVADCSSYLKNMTAVAAGDGHTLALKEDGSVWAWGGNWSGQLGVNTRMLSPIPVQVCAEVATTGECSAYLDQVFTLTAVYDQNMILQEDGTAWVWGQNKDGQLGDGSLKDRLIPVKICADTACESSLNNVAAFAVGKGHTLALKSDGTLLSWGRNHKGQLGESKLQRLMPEQVAELSDMIALAAGGSHSAGLKEESAGSGAGTVWAWGDNRSGQLGNGTTRLSSRPVQVCTDEDCNNYLNEVVALAAGESHTLALKNDRTVWAWGLNASGQLGNNSTGNQSIPMQVCTDVDCSSFLDKVTMLSAGDYHSVALREDGSIWAWGHNEDGQIADGTKINRLLPQQICLEALVEGVCPSQFIDVVAVGLHTMALKKEDGTVWAWGANQQGQLGNGSTDQSLIPVQVCAVADCASYLEGVTALADGNGSHSIVRKEDGTVWAWGANQQGQLGNGSTDQSLIPLPVCVEEDCSSSLSDVSLLAIGGAYSLVLSTNETVLGWGGNVRGQLGTGTTDQSLLPVQVCADMDCTTNFSDIFALATGREHSVALHKDATIWTWGLNDLGQLGNRVNPLLIRTTPDIVLGL